MESLAACRTGPPAGDRVRTAPQGSDHLRLVNRVSSRFRTVIDRNACFHALLPCLGELGGDGDHPAPYGQSREFEAVPWLLRYQGGGGHSLRATAQNATTRRTA